eukprot:TRINITY_DN2750_c0_g1_i1.p1 TRINITY_DN2750_c0_g1~~TRINITY_DN2750_c0_g1_i1.p1  ORF type:complete len:1671 (+),score=338.01 TRINITY_DN2750_c0_g1_i1:189-5201(+)
MASPLRRTRTRLKTEDDEKIEDSSILVGLRMRPLVAHEQGHLHCFSLSGNRVDFNPDTVAREDKAQHAGKGPYMFDVVMDSSNPSSPDHVSNEKCYALMGRPLVEQVFKGYNACLFCYGQTGTGKTATVMGNQELGQGLLPSILGDICDEADKLRQAGRNVSLVVQMLEVYNENINDLLVDRSRWESMRVKTRVLPEGVTLQGATHRSVSTLDECLTILAEGQDRQTVAKTKMNPRSSRSHMVFKVNIDISGGDDTSYFHAEAYFVDLAGHENIKTAEVTGQQLGELRHINSSLMYMRRAISDMARQSRVGKTNKKPNFTHFRNSELTLLLANGLIGNSKAYVVVTLSPSAAHCNASFDSIDFALEVKAIKVAVSANQGICPVAEVSRLQKVASDLKQQLDELNGADKAAEHPKADDDTKSDEDSKVAILVGLRMRPLVDHEQGQLPCLGISGNRIDVISENLAQEDRGQHAGKGPYMFDIVMDSSNPASSDYVSNDKCYELMGRPLVEQAFKGYNTCLFCYGQTGTGKTATVMGNQELGQGLLPRLLGDICDEADKLRQAGSKVSLAIQMLEVYNESINDLLIDRSKWKNVRIKTQVLPEGVKLQGASLRYVDTVDSCLKVLWEGQRRQTFAKTKMNPASSRGHLVFKLCIDISEPNVTQSSTGTTRHAEVYFADLAGHENIKTTEVAGQQLGELRHINSSLMYLQRAISDMAKQSRGRRTSRKTNFMHFRNSELTLLLANGLVGNSKAYLIVTMSPSAAHCDASLDSIEFALEVKGIKLAVSANVAVDPADEAARLQLIVEDLTRQVEERRSEQSGQMGSQRQGDACEACNDTKTGAASHETSTIDFGSHGVKVVVNHKSFRRDVLCRKRVLHVKGFGFLSRALEKALQAKQDQEAVDALSCFGPDVIVVDGDVWGAGFQRHIQHFIAIRRQAGHKVPSLVWAKSIRMSAPLSDGGQPMDAVGQRKSLTQAEEWAKQCGAPVLVYWIDTKQITTKINELYGANASSLLEDRKFNERGVIQILSDQMPAWTAGVDGEIKSAIREVEGSGAGELPGFEKCSLENSAKGNLIFETFALPCIEEHGCAAFGGGESVLLEFASKFLNSMSGFDKARSLMLPHSRGKDSDPALPRHVGSSFVGSVPLAEASTAVDEFAQDPSSARLAAKALLLTGMKDGSLDKAVAQVIRDKEDELRSRAEALLINGASDGSLKKAVAEVIGDKEDEIRLKTKAFVINATRDGSLNKAVAEVIRDKEDEMKLKAKALLIRGMEDGSLDKAVAEVIRDREDEMRSKAKALLIHGMEDGSLDKAIAEVIQGQEDEMRLKTKSKNALLNGLQDVCTALLIYGGSSDISGKPGSLDSPLEWFGFKKTLLEQGLDWNEAFNELVETSDIMKRYTVSPRLPVPVLQDGLITNMSVLEIVKLWDADEATIPEDKAAMMTERFLPSMNGFESGDTVYYFVGPFQNKEKLLDNLKNDPMLQPVYETWSSFQPLVLDSAFALGSIYLQISWQGWFVRPVAEVTREGFKDLLCRAQDEHIMRKAAREAATRMVSKAEVKALKRVEDKEKKSRLQEVTELPTPSTSPTPSTTPTHSMSPTASAMKACSSEQSASHFSSSFCRVATLEEQLGLAKSCKPLLPRVRALEEVLFGEAGSGGLRHLASRIEELELAADAH